MIFKISLRIGNNHKYKQNKSKLKDKFKIQFKQPKKITENIVVHKKVKGAIQDHQKHKITKNKKNKKKIKVENNINKKRIRNISNISSISNISKEEEKRKMIGKDKDIHQDLDLDKNLC